MHSWIVLLECVIAVLFRWHAGHSACLCRPAVATAGVLLSLAPPQNLSLLFLHPSCATNNLGAAHGAVTPCKLSICVVESATLVAAESLKNPPPEPLRHKFKTLLHLL
jgi:hypothetical protein